MTSAELRRIVGAMTERPWRFRKPEPPAGSVDIHSPDRSDDQDPVAEWVQECNGVLNASAICTLANHADALVALVEACEQFARACSSDDDWAARQAIMAALAAVHATKTT